MFLFAEGEAPTVLGIFSLTITTLGGIVLSVLQWKGSAERIRLTFQLEGAMKDLAGVQSREKECAERQRVLEHEIAVLKATRFQSPLTNGFNIWARLGEELILDVSDGVSEVAGWRAIELKGEHLSVLLSEAVAAQHHQAVARAKESGQMRRPEHAIRTTLMTKDRRELPVLVVIEKDALKGDDVYRATVIRYEPIVK